MAANVETMFYTREKPWHGLGIGVKEAPTSEDALRLAGLDWKVVQQSIQTTNGIFLNGFYANVRETDGKVLGVVTDKYKLNKIAARWPAKAVAQFFTFFLK